MNKYCCEHFANKISDKNYTNGAFISCDDEWAINGCCGGGCYVVINMKFCPYCGRKLKRDYKFSFLKMLWNFIQKK